MNTLFSWIRRLYSLDTLDTRFTVSASTPLKAASDARPASAKDARANAIAHGASPSKWNTPEFFGYYFVFITVVPMMFKTVVDVSKGRPDEHHRNPNPINPANVRSRELSNLPDLFFSTVARLDTRTESSRLLPPETMAGY